MATLSAPSDMFISLASAAYGASDCPSRKTFAARNAPHVRAGRTHPAISQPPGRSTPTPNGVRRCAPAFHRAPARAGSALRPRKIQAAGPAAFERAMPVFFVGHEEFQGSQEKRSEPALFRVGAIEISHFQNAREELLREILRRIGLITPPAQIGIQRVPLVLTQGNQSGPSFLPTWIAGSDHQGPPRRRKLG
jgi:hypothetical protein